MKSSFKLRPFISFFLSFSFIGLLITGIVLYIVPPGRIANWGGWTLMGLTKKQWEALHTTGALSFVIFSIMHIVLNWKVILNYLRHKSKRTLNRTKELIIAALLFIFIVIGTIANWAPFSTIMEIGEKISNSW